jgi:hypothetical protein
VTFGHDTIQKKYAAVTSGLNICGKCVRRGSVGRFGSCGGDAGSVRTAGGFGPGSAAGGAVGGWG